MDKIKEQKILERVYNKTNKDKFKIIDYNSEKPDFVLEDLSTKEQFGVEITDMYYSQYSAMLKEIPNFISDSLNNGIPRRAQGELNVHQLYVDINNKWTYLGDTIGHKFKKYDDYINRLIETINLKGEKAKKYKKLDYFELFIDDKEKYLFFKNINELSYLEKSSKLIEAILNSPYKRIYFFTVINRENVLLIFGDLSSGPLLINHKEFIKHKEYMNALYNKTDKKCSIKSNN